MSNNYKKINGEFYHFEKLNFDGGLLDESVDATYIIHLEGNGRLEHIHSQLKQYHPTSTVYILFNKGYKNGNKNLCENSPRADLIDAFLTVMKDASNKKYGNILILEDDFEFNDKIRNKSICKEIGEFINYKSSRNQSFIYMLGCVPFVQISYYNNTRIALFSLGAHACIYSKSAQHALLQFSQTKMLDWDFIIGLLLRRYMYKDPLCYQLFPDTENSKNWAGYHQIIIRLIFKWLKMDTITEPGYSYFYFYSKMVIWLWILSIMIGLVCLYYIYILLDR